MAANLSGTELTKRGREWRLGLFIKKYKNREEFTLTNGKKVRLLYEKVIEDRLERKSSLDSIVFTTVDSSEVKLKDLAKTKEFGGMADIKKSTTHIEEKEIVSIREQLNEIREKTKEPTVPLKVAGKIYDVFDIQKTEGTPKSDFHFLDINGKPVVWCSHKDGKKASDFQQWGGISKVVPNTHSHNETKKFINQMKETFPEGMKSASAKEPPSNVVKEIGDSTLKAKAVYGDDFRRGSKIFGEDNVTIVLQGPVKLRKFGSYYTLVANHAHENGQIMKGDYEPIFNSSYRQGRGQEGLKDARLAIWPKYVEKRPKTIKLPKK
jgi:hypothetical protein